MEPDLFSHLRLESSQKPSMLTDEVLFGANPSPSNSLTEELLTTSYAIIGKKKSIRSARELRMRCKKTFVQKVFLQIVDKFSEKQLQSLLYLDFFQELCSGIVPYPHMTGFSTYFHNRPASPYFVRGQNGNKPPKIRHASLKQRFLKLAHTRTIALRPKDHFQLACTLQTLWEEATRIVEHGSHLGSTLHTMAEQVLAIAKELPTYYNPLEEKKNLIHISSFKIPAKTVVKRLKPQSLALIERFIQSSIVFGYEYFGLAEPEENLK